jgi:hypothetical protein
MAPLISRQGLTQCPSCSTHIRADEARCPFCGEARKELDRTMLSALKDLFGARGGAMATSLVSLGIAVGCSSTPVPLYGIAPFDSGSPAQDTGAVDSSALDTSVSDSGVLDTGAPPADAGVQDVGPAPDLGTPVPLYGGGPADAGVTDTGTDKDAEQRDVPIGTLYGIAPVDGG